MKRFLILLGVVILGAWSAPAEDADLAANLLTHAVTTTIESTTLDDQGEIKELRIVNALTLNIRKTVTEVRQKDKKGLLQTVSRATEITDGMGRRQVVVEALLPGNADLVITSLTTLEKIPGGFVTTIKNRDKAGSLQIVSRTTAIRNDEGVNVTTVETPDKNGRLAVSHTTYQY